MIETRVRVLANQHGIAMVEATERNGCAACTSQDSCGLSGLGRALSRHRQAVPLACGDARPGQELTVAIAEADLLMTGLWAYGLPIVLALAGAAGLTAWGDAASAAGAGVGLLAGLLIARRFAAPPRIFITSGD